MAISFLNAYLNPVHENYVVKVMSERLPHVFVTVASELSCEWFEYEPTSTAVANVYVGPKSRGYVNRFDEILAAEEFPALFYMMGSNGGCYPRSAPWNSPSR